MRFHGKIGFVATTSEDAPSVWKEKIVEREYKGTILRATRTAGGTDKVNGDIQLNNQLSIIADSFANENLYSIKYVTWRGCKWRITNVEVNYPRLILTFGGVYDG